MRTPKYAILTSLFVLAVLTGCNHHSHRRDAVLTPVIPCPDHDHANEVGTGHHDHDPCKDDEE